MRMNPLPRINTVPFGLALAVLLLAGCGKSPAAPTAATAGEPAAAATTPAQPAGADAGGLAGRRGTLNDPDNATMVFLYYDLAGIAPPVDQWVEADQRVRYAPGADKAARRVSLSVKALEMAEEKEAIEQFGSSDSGASLGDILGAALREKAQKE